MFCLSGRADERNLNGLGAGAWLLPLYSSKRCSRWGYLCISVKYMILFSRCYLKMKAYKAQEMNKYGSTFVYIDCQEHGQYLVFDSSHIRFLRLLHAEGHQMMRESWWVGLFSAQCWLIAVYEVLIFTQVSQITISIISLHQLCCYDHRSLSNYIATLILIKAKRTIATILFISAVVPYSLFLNLTLPFSTLSF